MDHATLLLTGATGYVGGRLLHLLENAKRNVRCLARDPRRLERYRGPRTEICEGDVLDKESLLKACQGIDTAFYLVHSMGAKRNFEETEEQGARNFAEACAVQGVKKIIYLGGLGEEKARKLSPHLRSRHHVGDILRSYAGKTQVIEFRASVIIGSGSLSFEMVRALCERLPVMITPRWVWTAAQPIAISDVITFLVRAIDKEVENHPIFEIGGADQVTYADLMREYARIKGYKRWIIPVPVLTPYLSSLWLGLVTPLYARVGRKLVESACFPTIVKNPGANEIFGVEPLGMKEAMEKALKKEEEERFETRWVDSFSAVGLSPPSRKALEHCFHDSQGIDVDVSHHVAFSPILQIGGNQGWYYANFLWRIRGFLDLLAGGPGYRRGRRDPHHITTGEVIDFWRVEAYEPNRLLRLEAEMKVPGRAWLEFQVHGSDQVATIEQNAIFEPRSLFGILYWYGLYPMHRMIFQGMIRRIADEARRRGKALSKQERQDPRTLCFIHWSRIAASGQRLFAWHEAPGAFEKLLSPGEKIIVVEKTGPLSENPTVRIKQKIGFFWKEWVLQHRGYEKNKEFVDEAIQGPFPHWEHLHRVIPVGENESLLLDKIVYRLPFGWIGRFFLRNYLEGKLRKTFRYRHEIIRKECEEK